MACLTPASANATSLYYAIQNDCWTEIPDSTEFKKIRFTGGVPTLQMDPLTSSELDGSPEITGIRLGSRQVNNEAAVELYYGAHDDLLESVMQSGWVAGTPIASQSIVIDATALTATIVGYDATTEIAAGGYIKFPDLLLGGNNQPLIATAVNFAVDTVINLAVAKADNPTAGISGLVNETASSTITIADKLKVGTTRKKIALLVEYGDIDGGPTYDLTLDAEATGFNFNVAVNAIVTGSISFIGRFFGQNVTLPPTTTLVDNNSNKPFTGIDGSFVKNDTPLLLSTSADISLDRGATPSFEIGSKFMSHVSYGKATNEVSVGTFFYDYALSGDYENEVEGDYTIAVSLDGKAMSFTYPTAIITGLDPDVSEGDITQTATLSPYKPAGQDSSLIIQRIE
jgi:hypothetical protein